MLNLKTKEKKIIKKNQIIIFIFNQNNCKIIKYEGNNKYKIENYDGCIYDNTDGKHMKFKDKNKQSRIITADIKYKSKVIKLINIYTPNGNPVDTEKYDYKLYWLDSLIKKLKSLLKTNENIRTMGIALTPTILPQAGKPTFEIGDDEMEIGMGIHGEPGIRRGKLKTANEITEELSEKLLNDIDLNKGDKVSILINSLGATPHEELFIVADKFNNILNDNGIINSKSYVGRYATSMEMAGMSITILKLDDELEKLLLEESNCPFWY